MSRPICQYRRTSSRLSAPIGSTTVAVSYFRTPRSFESGKYGRHHYDRQERYTFGPRDTPHIILGSALTRPYRKNSENVCPWSTIIVGCLGRSRSEESR